MCTHPITGEPRKFLPLTDRTGNVETEFVEDLRRPQATRQRRMSKLRAIQFWHRLASRDSQQDIHGRHPLSAFDLSQIDRIDVDSLRQHSRVNPASLRYFRMPSPKSLRFFLVIKICLKPSRMQQNRPDSISRHLALVFRGQSSQKYSA